MIKMLTVVAICFATSAHAKLKSYGSRYAPTPVDTVPLSSAEVSCQKILSLKGWIKYAPPSDAFRDVADGDLWLKEDRYARCGFMDIELYSKSEVDSYVEWLTERRAKSQENAQKAYTEGLNKL